MAAKTRHPIESIAATSLWVECLLELFWEVDKVFKDHVAEHEMHPEIREAYLRAEAARREL